MENDTVRPHMSRSEALRAWSWPILCVSLLLAFGTARLYRLEARPLHHDEGVNGIFMKNLLEKGRWNYDPQNYHGPTLFFFQVPVSWAASVVSDGLGHFSPRSLAGLATPWLRGTTAVAGILLLALLLRATPLLGRLGAAAACVFAGLSCDLFFFSRYFIHETYVLLFTLGLVLGAHRYRATRRRRHAFCAAMSATLLFCTKETALFHFTVLGLAWLCADLTRWLATGRAEPFGWREKARAPARLAKELGLALPVVATACLAVWAVLFTSFFTNVEGPLDSLRTFVFWGPEGLESGHAKPFFYYFTEILLRYEPVELLFGVVGMAAAFIRNERRGLFLTFWTLGMAGFYSVVPYKTPWLVVNISLPLAIVAGYGVRAVVETVRQRLSVPHARTVLVALSGLALFLAAAEARLTWRVNFVENDNDRHPQIYAHTSREINDIVARVGVASIGAGRDMVINVFSDTYWPLPLSLVHYPNARFWGTRIPEEPADAPVLIVSPKLQAQVDAKTADTYSIRPFNLRGGVPLLLYLNTRLGASAAQMLPPLDFMRSEKPLGDLRTGLRLEVFDNTLWSRQPVHVVEGDASFDFFWRTDAEKRYAAPFSLRWTGYLKVETAGSYRVSLESDDGSWLLVDGEVAIDNGGDHAAVRLERELRLSAGFHRIEVKHFDAGGEAVLRLKWTRPGGSETAIPANAFFSNAAP